MGPSIADANGRDEYDDSYNDDGGSCAGPNLHGLQLGGFISPSVIFHAGHFTANLALTYRYLRQSGGSDRRTTRFLGISLGLGIGIY